MTAGANRQYSTRSVGRVEIVFPQGVGHATEFAKRMSDGDDLDLPDIVIGVIAELCEQLLFLHEKIASYCLKMAQAARREKRVALIQTIPPLLHENMHCRAAGTQDRI